MIKHLIILIPFTIFHFNSLFSQTHSGTENNSFQLKKITKEIYDSIASENDNSSESYSRIIASEDHNFNFKREHSCVQSNNDGIIIKTDNDTTFTFLNDTTDGERRKRFKYDGYMDFFNSHLVYFQGWEYNDHKIINAQTGEIRFLPSIISLIPEKHIIVGFQCGPEGGCGIHIYKLSHIDMYEVNWNPWEEGLEGMLDDFFVDFSGGIYIKTRDFNEKRFNHYNIPLD